MTLRSSTLGLAAWLPVAACTANSRPEAPSAALAVAFAQQFQLAPGQTARLVPEDLRVTFEGVEGDSRCPVDVQCVWEGDAVVVLSVRSPSTPAATVQLHTAGRFEREATHGRYRVRLIALSPEPREGQPIAPGRYRATLLVTAQ